MTFYCYYYITIVNLMIVIINEMKKQIKSIIYNSDVDDMDSIILSFTINDK